MILHCMMAVRRSYRVGHAQAPYHEVAGWQTAAVLANARRRVRRRHQLLLRGQQAICREARGAGGGAHPGVVAARRSRVVPAAAAGRGPGAVCSVDGGADGVGPQPLLRLVPLQGLSNDSSTVDDRRVWRQTLEL